MRPHLVQSHLHLPPQNKPFDDLGGTDRLVGTKQRLGNKLSLWIAKENPADGNGWQPTVIPDSSAARHFPRDAHQCVSLSSLLEEGTIGESTHPCELDTWERENNAPGQSHSRAKTAQTNRASRRRELSTCTPAPILTGQQSGRNQEAAQ